MILIAGVTNVNPGPSNKCIFACRLYEIPVTWQHIGVYCTACGITKPAAILALLIALLICLTWNSQVLFDTVISVTLST